MRACVVRTRITGYHSHAHGWACHYQSGIDVSRRDSMFTRDAIRYIVDERMRTLGGFLEEYMYSINHVAILVDASNPHRFSSR